MIWGHISCLLILGYLIVCARNFSIRSNYYTTKSSYQIRLWDAIILPCIFIKLYRITYSPTYQINTFMINDNITSYYISDNIIKWKVLILVVNMKVVWNPLKLLTYIKPLYSVLMWHYGRLYIEILSNNTYM